MPPEDTATAAARPPALPRAGDAEPSPDNLRDAVRYFLGRPSVALILLGLAGAVTARMVSGPPQPTRADAIVLLAFSLFQPFQEWLIHVYILHWRPRKVLGFNLDLHLAQTHRVHHNDPWKLEKVFIPLPAIAFSVVFNVILWESVMPSRALAATALIAVSVIGLVYEWIHFLIHTSYVPRGFFYRQLWRYHRLHHFKNEGYWFGVTNHFGDRVLRTQPDAKDVPTSPTARTLGFEPASE